VVIPFSAAVLTGGASRRMGRDKAVGVAVDGRPLARRVADALEAAGADEVLAVGGDMNALAALGLRAHADDHPGDGPLGGILTAIRTARHDIVVVVACDLPWLDAATVAALVHALGAHPGAAVALARTDRREPLCATWRGSRAAPVLAERFAAGERAPRRALDWLDVVEVDVDPAVLRNTNTPADLPPG
jgi:molybdopterin-guanine dinucleotide biosynthesis protein A